ncbi:MAG: alginate export family protein [Spirochaetes bacterium]|nr:alginate export family protein [Spirochaetota bacterium]
MKRLLIITLTAVLLPVSLYAQKKVQTEELKSQAEIVDQDMAASIKQRSYLTDGVQFGGWITTTLYDQWNDDQSLAIATLDTRLWVKSYIWKDIFAYGRIKDTFTRIIKNKDYPDMDKTDNDIDLDMLYAGMTTPDKNMTISAGRKFYTIGTGLVLNGRGDGADFGYYSPVININALGMYTGLLSEENNPYGLSSKDISDGAKRAFLGSVFSRTIENQAIYAFVLMQFDRQDDAEDDRTKYDSQYWGAGSKGFVGENISYYAELVYETGKSYTGGGDKETISAYAVNAEADYYFNMKYNPTAIFQYAMGSGDKDRGSKAPNGNTSGKDNGFTYFGTYLGGYALRPYLMNIHILRLGGSIAPMSESNKLLFKRMYVIFKYSLYLKDKTEAPLPDTGASGNKRIAGHGLDLSYKWILYSDLSVFLNCAMFIPGSAYPSGSSNQYFVFGGFNFAF